MCGYSKIDFDSKIIWQVGDSITLGIGDGISNVGGCGWRGILQTKLAASGINPVFVGTLTGGYLMATCPENGLAMAHDGHSGFRCDQIQEQIGTWFAAIGGTFDDMILMAGTNDLLKDQLDGTSLAQGHFDALLADAVALKPASRFFVSNLPPSPGLFTPGSLGPAFAAHVAASVATYQAGGTNMHLIDHFNGTTPNGTVDQLLQTTGNSGEDFDSGTVHPAGPGGVATPYFQGYPKMALITYLTLTHTAP